MDYHEQLVWSEQSNTFHLIRFIPPIHSHRHHYSHGLRMQTRFSHWLYLSFSGRTGPQICQTYPIQLLLFVTVFSFFALSTSSSSIWPSSWQSHRGQGQRKFMNWYFLGALNAINIIEIGFLAVPQVNVIKNSAICLCLKNFCHQHVMMYVCHGLPFI